MEICNLLLESGCIAIPIKSIGNLHKQLLFFWGINSAKKKDPLYTLAKMTTLIALVQSHIIFTKALYNATKTLGAIMTVIYLQADKYRDGFLNVVWGSCSIFNFKVFSCLCTIILQMEQMHWLVLFILYTVVF